MRIWSHLLKKSLMGNFIFLQWIVNELVKENVLLLENNSVPPFVTRVDYNFNIIDQVYVDSTRVKFIKCRAAIEEQKT